MLPPCVSAAERRLPRVKIIATLARRPCVQCQASAWNNLTGCRALSKNAGCASCTAGGLRAAGTGGLARVTAANLARR